MKSYDTQKNMSLRDDNYYSCQVDILKTTLSIIR